MGLASACPSYVKNVAGSVVTERYNVLRVNNQTLSYAKYGIVQCHVA